MEKQEYDQYLQPVEPHLFSRGSLHYIAAVLSMGMYGGQVCPLVETLTMQAWMFELLLIFSLGFAVRWVLFPLLVNKTAPQNRVIVQFWFEFFWFCGIGLLIALVNKTIYHFPTLESGAKILVGILALGFFLAIDLALERERIIDKQMELSGLDLVVKKNYFPITYKFAVVATISSVTVAVIVLLVVLKDLGWMVDISSIDLESARVSVFKEILFVTVIFLAHVINIIISYAKNLTLAVKKENEALIQVSKGDLDTAITVSSNDEFGVMAQYTNTMIDQLRVRTHEIQQTRDATIVALAGLAETRDNETGAHILRTQNYVKVVAEHLQAHPRFSSFLDEKTIDLMYKSAPLHDIGKVGIPDHILLKPDRLTEVEFEIMKSHTILGKQALELAAQNLEDNNFLRFAQEIAISHHEKWDGSGYPQGLKGDQIPPAGRLMALADVYDALISKRVYKPAFSHAEARTIMVKARGTHFDPDVLDAFVAVEDRFIEIAARFRDRPSKAR